MTPEEIRRALAEAEAAAIFHEAKATSARAEVSMLRQALAISERHQVNSGSMSGKQMQPPMSAETKLAISKGRKGDKDGFSKAIRKAGYTMRSLADKLGCSVTLISLQRKGRKPILIERARLIQDLTGWPADYRHWKRLG